MLAGLARRKLLRRRRRQKSANRSGASSRGIRWKAELPGRGNSSPVVWDDYVIITSAVGDGEGSQLVVCAFDRQTGKPHWQTEAAKASGSTHNKNGFASASVATDGQQVFASFGSAGLFAFDLSTGRQLWHAELGSLEHQWGSASSPVLVGNVVVQLCDSAAESNIRAFDKATGELIWKTDRPSHGCWTTPVLVTAHDASDQPRQELVVNGTGMDGAANGYVIAYDPTDGHELWRVQGTTDVVCPTAIVGSGLVDQHQRPQWADLRHPTRRQRRCDNHQRGLEIAARRRLRAHRRGLSQSVVHRRRRRRDQLLQSGQWRTSVARSIEGHFLGKPGGGLTDTFTP